MGRHHHDKGRLAPFVPLFIATLDSAAWRAMSHGARSLYIALKRRFNRNAPNNGRIFLSQRKAAEELGSHHNQIARWYRELQYYGFIVMATPGYLGLEGKGQAPRWRLTELPSRQGGELLDWGTRDYERWDGRPFDHRRRKTRAGKPARGVQENQHTPVLEDQPSIMATVLEKQHKETGGSRAGKPAQN